MEDFVEEPRIFRRKKIQFGKRLHVARLEMPGG
jgi:hypothetical protein